MAALPPPVGYAAPTLLPRVPPSPSAFVARDLAWRDMHEKEEINRSAQKMLSIIEAEKGVSLKARDAEAAALKMAAAAVEQAATAAQAEETARRATTEHATAITAAGAAASIAATKASALEEARAALSAAEEAAQKADAESSEAESASKAAADDAASKQALLIAALSDEEKQHAKAVESRHAAAAATAASNLAQGAVVQCRNTVAVAVAELNAQRNNHATIVHGLSPQRVHPPYPGAYAPVPTTYHLPSPPPPPLHTPVHRSYSPRPLPLAPPAHALLRYTSPPLSPAPPVPVRSEVERDIAALLEKVDGLDAGSRAKATPRVSGAASTSPTTA